MNQLLRYKKLILLVCIFSIVFTGVANAGIDEIITATGETIGKVLKTWGQTEFVGILLTFAGTILVLAKDGIVALADKLFETIQSFLVR